MGGFSVSPVKIVPRINSTIFWLITFLKLKETMATWPSQVMQYVHWWALIMSSDKWTTTAAILRLKIRNRSATCLSIRLIQWDQIQTLWGTSLFLGEVLLICNKLSILVEVRVIARSQVCRLKLTIPLLWYKRRIRSANRSKQITCVASMPYNKRIDFLASWKRNNWTLWSRPVLFLLRSIISKTKFSAQELWQSFTLAHPRRSWQRRKTCL